MLKKILKIAALSASASFAAVAGNAATIGTFDHNSYVQSGTVTNLYSSAITAFQIDFVVDSGSPASAIWETGVGGAPGSPAATFTNLVSGGAFTATFEGLNVGSGGTFVYGNMDYGGFNGSSAYGTLIPNFRGDEFATIFFADGSSVSTFLNAGPSGMSGNLVFDDGNLVNGDGPSPVPLPASLPLLLGALGGFGIMRRRKKA